MYKISLAVVLTFVCLASCAKQTQVSNKNIQTSYNYRGVSILKELDCGAGLSIRDLYVEDVPGSKSYYLGPWVEVINTEDHHSFYVVKGYNRFYLNSTHWIASTRQFYGPFEGDPKLVFPK